MVNAQLGMNYELSQTLQRIQNQLAAMSTQPVLLHASTGQDGGQGLSTDKAGLHLFNPSGAEVVTLSTLDGSATLGNTTITGNLSVPNGSISNSALSAPVVPAAYHADIQNISITSGSNVEKLHYDVPVPAGYTQALVNLTVTMNMLNNSGAADSAFLGANINGTSPGWSSNATAAAGAEVSLNNTVVAQITGLTGGSTFPLSGKASSNTGTWAAAGTSSVMNLNATVLFLR
ncbi:hypothetical protein ACFFGR_09110 [Arthrobacter liuii]|uniref:Uncharacterized protein n=1 Tax=Arthrobacter liuii TaxID=1476996 RepID=A0ABQ2AMD7_9MICC|nr:hypothetical protein [Arthrobacter liuii]GGH93709.1 hypothetical protein GCM10007170_15210 [Arthrobacter liuii]